MRVLITGAAGLLGQKLITLLCNKPDIELIVTANRPLPFLSKKNKFILFDITVQQEVYAIIANTKPAVIIHAAAMTQVDQCEKNHDLCHHINTVAVKHLIRACEKTHTHFVFISTDFVFDGHHSPMDETAIPNPINYYGQSKLEAEHLLKKSNLEWSIIRTALVYGVAPDINRSSIVLWIKKSLEENKIIKMVNDQWRTPTLAEDLAISCYLIAYKKATGLYHITGENILTPYEIAKQTAQFFNLDLALIESITSSKFKQLAKRPLKTGLVIDKAKTELLYQPHSFQEGLQIIASQL